MHEPDFSLSHGEYQLFKMLWEHQPISTSVLMTLCAEQLQWNKFTTLTHLLHLNQKGILENKESIIKLLVSKDEVDQSRIDAFIESTFLGSASELIAFLEKYYRMKQ